MIVNKRSLGSVAALGLAALAALAVGCIRSRVEITSEPAAAEVSWRGKPYGATPITIPFIWYWHYDIALEKPGYQRLETDERLRTPPWFMLPLDLFMEAVPVPITDTRHRHYTLKPIQATPDNLPAARQADAGSTLTLTRP
jgi:hypothetical protein